MSVLREIFSDGKNRLSSFRIMAMIGLVSGCTAMLAQVFGYGENVDLTSALAFLFGGVFGGKAGQAFAENRNQR